MQSKKPWYLNTISFLLFEASCISSGIQRRLGLNSSRKLILCRKGTGTAHKLSNISLEYGAIFDERYAKKIFEL